MKIKTPTSLYHIKRKIHYDLGVPYRKENTALRHDKDHFVNAVCIEIRRRLANRNTELSIDLLNII